MGEDGRGLWAELELWRHARVGLQIEHAQGVAALFADLAV